MRCFVILIMYVVLCNVYRITERQFWARQSSQTRLKIYHQIKNFYYTAVSALNKIVVLIKIKNTNTKNIKSKYNPQGWNRWYNCRTSTFYTEDYYQSQYISVIYLSLILFDKFHHEEKKDIKLTKYYSIVSIYMTSIPVLQIFYLIEDLDNFFSGLAAGIPGQCFLIFFYLLVPTIFCTFKTKIFWTINIQNIFYNQHSFWCKFQ